LVEELEQASRFRSEFVANVSHELRNPLNVIIGYTDLLIAGAYGALSGEQEDVVRRTHRGGWELLDLVNATLDLSQMEAQRVPMHREDVQLAPLIHELARDTRAVPLKPGLQMIWTVSDDLPLLHTDALKLKMVLKNLVGNAIKFTDQGSVTVAACRLDGGVEISVSDTGIGIPADAMSIIFDAFRQVDGSTTRRHGGVGLGLYITRRLLDLLGGSIAVQSQVGNGSTFRVWLPFDENTAQPRANPQSEVSAHGLPHPGKGKEAGTFL